MSIINRVNNAFNSKTSVALLFGTTGAYKTFVDFKKASCSDKKSVLFRDASILSGSACGLILFGCSKKIFSNSSFHKTIKKSFYKSFEKFKNSSFNKTLEKNSINFLKKTFKSILKSSFFVTKDCLNDTLMVLSGIFGGIGTDFFISKSHKLFFDNKIKKENKLIEKASTSSVNKINYVDPFTKIKNKIIESDFNNSLNKIVDANIQREVLSNITNIHEMKMLSSTMIGLQSFEVLKEKSFKNKMKKTTENTITGSLVPMFFLSLSTNLTKGLNAFCRIPTILTSLVCGTFFTNKKIEPKIKQYFQNKQILKEENKIKKSITK